MLDEFQRAGVIDFRFSWTSEGRAEFDPAVPEVERAKVLGVLAAHDAPLASAREDKLAALRGEAKRRTAAEFARPADSPELIYQMINEIAEVWVITQKLAEERALDAPEIALVESARAKWAKVLGIAAAVSAARAAVEGALTVAEVEGVGVDWPGD